MAFSNPGRLGIIEERNVGIPMRDGVVLRGNLWRPDTSRPVPALLMRTPYRKADGGFDRYVQAGYAVLCQDVRGRYDSDGVFTVFTERTRDPEDGFDTVEWLAAQPWCDGNVGTFGASYCGWTQWQLAPLQPPHLRAMCARSIPTELRDVDWWGAFRPGRRIRWWLTTIAPDLRRRAGLPPPHTPAEAGKIWDEVEQGLVLGLLPWAAVVDRLPPPLNEQAARWLRNPGRRVWRLKEKHRDIVVPNLDFTGWFDHCWSVDHFTGMRRNGGSGIARRQTKVVIGPWSHVTIGRRECLGIDFGPAAQVDVPGMEIRWFDHWLKGIDNGVEDEPPVRYFVLGENRWKEAEDWPPATAESTPLFLAGPPRGEHDEKTDAPDESPPGTGRLLRSPQTEDTPDEYVYDPRFPVHTLWTRQLFAGASDRNRLDYRVRQGDILVYRSEPLQEQIGIAGHPECVLFAATTAPDTDFFVYLVDEYPEGGPALQVAFGMVRARHRNSIDREDPVTPGEIVEYRIRLTATACVFRPGHRIRLDVTSSDFPNFDRNHNTGGNDLFETRMEPARQTILHAAAHPSRIILPVVHA